VSSVRTIAIIRGLSPQKQRCPHASQTRQAVALRSGQCCSPVCIQQPFLSVLLLLAPSSSSSMCQVCSETLLTVCQIMPNVNPNLTKLCQVQTVALEYALNGHAQQGASYASIPFPPSRCRTCAYRTIQVLAPRAMFLLCFPSHGNASCPETGTLLAHRLREGSGFIGV
jgi:hypothetical protein